MDQVSPLIAGFRAALTTMVKEDYFAILRDFAISRETLLRKYHELLLSKINGFIVICNFTTGQYEYVSESMKDNLGYDVRDYSIEQLSHFLSSIIYEKHLNVIVNSYMPMFCKYLKENATAVNGTDYRSTCCSKLKNIYNVYEWYLLDTAVVQVDETGFPLVTLITCTNINLFKKDECFYYNIQKKNDDGVYQVMLEGTGTNELDGYNLTPREIEIIILISHGHSNKKIADKLSISVHTVQTHRKRIIKKVKCKGTAELTNFAYSRGLL